MATTTSRLQLVIAGDNKSAIKSIQGTDKALGGLQGTLKGIGAGVAGGALAAGGLALGREAVDAASNLYEQQTKVKTIFGESADEALRFAASADKSYGQSERQALEAVGVFGNLFTAVGLAQDQSLEMSVTLDKLASDLASFNNVPVDDALTAIRAGLVGEQEPLRRFGVNLNEATLKARAMTLGLHEGNGVLSASAKAQAAYSLILEQTSTAQGDFARTSDGLANQQRIAQAEWENTKAALGESLLPTMKSVVGVLNVGLDLFSKLPGPIRTGTVAVTGLALAVGFLGPPLKAGLTSFGLMGPAATSAASGVAAMAPASVAAATGVEGLAAAQTAGAASANALASAEAAAAAQTKALLVQLSLVESAALVGMAAVSKVKPIKDLDRDTFEMLPEGYKNMKASAGEVTGALVDYIATTGQAARGTAGLADVTDDAAAATDDLRTETEKANDAAQEAIDRQGKLTDARESYTDAAADSARADYELGVAQQEAAGNSEEYREAEERVTEALVAVDEAKQRVRDAQLDLNDARKEAAQRLRDMADAERDAALASQDANLKVKEALNEQRRINADPGSTELEKERAALAVAQAREDARQAGQDAAQAAIDNAEAQRKGIEGDAEVVRAKQAVADANKGVRDAVNGVREAEAEAAKVIAEAKARVLEAQKAASDAALDEAEAWGDLVTQQFGAVAGAQAYRDKLAEIARDLDPNAPLTQRIARLIADINRAITEGTTRPASAQPGGGQTGTIGNTSQIPSGDRSSGDKVPSVSVVNNNTFLGTPTSTRRAQDQAAERTIDRAVRKLR